MKKESPLEALLAVHIRADKLPEPKRQAQLNPERKWRIDFAWPDMRVAVEVDGEVHRIKERFHADIEKHAWLTLNGWTLLRVGGREVRSGKAIEWIKRLVWERAPLGFMAAAE
jgi:very-short-patch-repair endonuclease